MRWPWIRRPSAEEVTRHLQAEAALSAATADHADADHLRLQAAQIRAALEERRRTNHLADALTALVLRQESA